jgi:hypothetical protein
MEVWRIPPERRGRRIASALLLSGLLLTFALPAHATAAVARMTVTINSVTNISAGDPFFGAPDFVTRIYLGNNVGSNGFFQGPVVADSNTPSTAGWSHTRSLSTALNGVTMPVRIELWDSNDPFPSDLVDIDPGTGSGPCAGTSASGNGCATLSTSRPPVDPFGLDLSLGVNPPAAAPTATFTGVDSAAGGDAAGTAGARTCVAGSQGESARICFTITVTRTPETLRVTKRADTDDGRCLPSDCSLRDAVTVAGPGDTIMLPDLGGPYLLTSTGTSTDNPGHLKITQPGMRILGPSTGAIIAQTRPILRVFDIHPSAGLDLRNVTLTGGVAFQNSTAFMAHIHGGAIHNHGTLKLVNVTITGNHANESNVPSLGGGGGIYNATTGTADLTNVTIADNDASVNAGGLAGTPMTLHNVLIVDNTGGNGNCDHAEIDDGGNLQFPAGACGVPVATLKPIGQLTDGVYRLPAGSEAIDHGTFGGRGPHTFKGDHVPTRCPAGDQIGTRRPLDGDGDGTALCDTGAIEFPPTGADVVHRPLGLPGRLHPVTLTFDTIRSSGTSTLRIVRARADAPKGFRALKPAQYYDLATTARYTGRIGVCVRYRRQAPGKAATVRLFQQTKSTWTDRTVSRGTRSHRVCGRSGSLGRYALFAGRG